MKHFSQTQLYKDYSSNGYPSSFDDFCLKSTNNYSLEEWIIFLSYRPIGDNKTTIEKVIKLKQKQLIFELWE